MFWTIASFVLSFAIFFAAQPKPETQPPAGIDEVNAPTAEIGREISVLFGKRKFDGANVTWFGHLRALAIKKKGGKK
jgi:hypothetical protein